MAEINLKNEELSMGEKKRKAKLYLINWLQYAPLPNGNEEIEKQLREIHSNLVTNGQITTPDFHKHDSTGQVIPALEFAEDGKIASESFRSAYASLRLGEPIDETVRSMINQLNLGEKTRLAAMIAANVLERNDSLHGIDDLVLTFDIVYSCIVSESKRPLPN
jgi:hypothetical protein